MSGGEERSEKPTSRRIDEARKRGQVAKSTDLTSAAVMGGMLLSLVAFGSYMIQYGLRLQHHVFNHMVVEFSKKALTAPDFIHLLGSMVFHLAMMAAPFVGFAAVMAVGVNLLQVKPMISFEVIQPKLDKLNPLQGAQRLFSRRALIEFIKGLIKLAIVAWVCYAIIQSQFRPLMNLGQESFAHAWGNIFGIIIQMTFAIVVVLFVLGLADWRYQIFELMKQLRMTKQEIKDEMRNTEGNPQIKHKIRATGRQMMRQRMLTNVATADVVITNPTHISVALKYDPDECPAPFVVAKGADHLAFRIRELAKEHSVPIIENKPLARTLYSVVEVEKMIPPELFIGVAQILALVFNKQKGRKRQMSSNKAPAATQVIKAFMD